MISVISQKLIGIQDGEKKNDKLSNEVAQLDVSKRNVSLESEVRIKGEI